MSKRCDPECAYYRPGRPYRSVPRKESRWGVCDRDKREVPTGGIWAICAHGGPHIDGRLF